MYQMPKDGALVFPALSIPVVNKDEFSLTFVQSNRRNSASVARQPTVIIFVTLVNAVSKNATWSLGHGKTIQN